MPNKEDLINSELNTEATFVNQRNPKLNGYVQWTDWKKWILPTMLVALVIGGILYGALDNYVPFLVFALLGVLIAGIGFIPVKSLKLWVYIVKFTKYHSPAHKKVFTGKEIDFNSPIKGYAILLDDQKKQSNVANVMLLEDSIGGSVALAYRLRPNSLESYLNNYEKLTQELIAFSDAFVKTSRLDKKGLAVDFAYFDNQKFNFDSQIKYCKEGLKNAQNPTRALTLMWQLRFWESNIKGALDRDVEMQMYENGDSGDINVLNRTYVIILKGRSYGEVSRHADMFREAFAPMNNGILPEPLTVYEMQQLINKYYGNIINFANERPFHDKFFPDSPNTNHWDLVYLTAAAKDDNDVASLISPPIVKIREFPTYLEFTHKSGKVDYWFVRGFKDFPNKFDIGWMTEFMQSSVGVMVTNKFQFDTKRKVDRYLAKILKTNNKHFAIQPSDIYKAQQFQASVQDSILFNDQLQRGNVTMMKYRFYVLMRASKKEQIEDFTNNFHDKLTDVLGISDDKYEDYLYQQFFAWQSAFPNGTDLYRNEAHNLNWISSMMVAKGYPFSRSGEFPKEGGVFLGLNSTRDNVVMFNPMSGQNLNYNGLIVGTSGGGKSFTIKSLMLQLSAQRNPATVWVIDPNNEYEATINALGGKYIQTDENIVNAYPVEEKALAKKYPLFRDKDLLSRLKQMTVNSHPLITEAQYPQKSTLAYYVKIFDKDFKDTQFEDYLNHSNYSLSLTEKLVALYRIIYQESVKRFTISPFKIYDTKGGYIDPDSKMEHRASAVEIYDAYISTVLVPFFNYLLKHQRDFQARFLRECIEEVYRRFHLYKCTNLRDGSQFLSKDGSANPDKRFTIDDFENYVPPTMNDFYRVILDKYKVEYYDENIPENRRVLLFDLKEGLKRYVAYFDEDKETTVVGDKANLWNERNNDFQFNESYIGFNVAAIAKAVEDESEPSPDTIYSTDKSAALAQLFLIITLFRSRSARNGLENIKATNATKHYLFLIWDEYHNLIKTRMGMETGKRLIKEGRKYQTGVYLITQDLQDFTDVPGADQIFNSTSNRFYMAAGARGVKALKEFYSAMATDGHEVLSTFDIGWITNPRGVDTTMVPTVQSKPPGYALFSPYSNDAILVPLRIYVPYIHQMIVGSYLFGPSGLPLTEIFDDAEEGIMPRMLDGPNAGQIIKMPHFIQSVIRDAKKIWLENLTKRVENYQHDIENLLENTEAINQFTGRIKPSMI